MQLHDQSSGPLGHEILSTVGYITDEENVYNTAACSLQGDGSCTASSDTFLNDHSWFTAHQTVLVSEQTLWIRWSECGTEHICENMDFGSVVKGAAVGRMWEYEEQAVLSLESGSLHKLKNKDFKISQTCFVKRFHVSGCKRREKQKCITTEYSGGVGHQEKWTSCWLDAHMNKKWIQSEGGVSVTEIIDVFMPLICFLTWENTQQ